MKKLLLIGVIMFVFVIVGCSTPAAEKNTTAIPSADVAQTPLESVPVENTTQSSSAEPMVTVGLKKDIVIENFAFDQKVLTVSKGATIIWTNRDSVGHTVTSDTGDELHSDLILQDETYAHTFSTVGTYTYHCGPHPSMKGTIIVE